MRATARRTTGDGFAHEIEIGAHRFLVDEPREKGGEDEGPGPLELLGASLAACTAITMEMYARRKDWQIGRIQVSADFEPGEKGGKTTFSLGLRLPADLTPDQVERLTAIAAKCPVHRVLEGETGFVVQVEQAATAHV